MPGTAPGVASGYRPRTPHNDLKEIVEDSLEDLFRVWDARFRESRGSLSPRVRELLERFLRCGDLHYGFARLRCVNPEGSTWGGSESSRPTTERASRASSPTSSGRR